MVYQNNEDGIKHTQTKVVLRFMIYKLRPPQPWVRSNTWDEFDKFEDKVIVMKIWSAIVFT